MEAAFAEIVAGWDEPAEQAVGRWPAAEDVSGSPSADDVLTNPAVEAVDAALDRSPELGPRDWVPQLSPAVEEHFIPPDPGPLPRSDAFTTLSWAGVLLGPLFLVIFGVFIPNVGSIWIIAAVVTFIVSFSNLVMRMPTSRDDDDGAVV